MKIKGCKKMMKDYKHGFYMDFTTNESVEFNYCIELSTSEKIKFVNNVMSYVVGVYYYPMLRDAIFNYAIIQYFTDIRFDEDLNIDEIDTLLATTDIVDIVKMDMKPGLLDELNQMIDMNIEYKTGIHMNRIEIAVEKLVDVVKEKVINADTSKMMKLAEQMSGIKDKVTPDQIIESYMKSELFQHRKEEAAEEKKRKKKPKMPKETF